VLVCSITIKYRFIFSILLFENAVQVPGAKSSPARPGIVTRPGFVGVCIVCGCSLVRAKTSHLSINLTEFTKLNEHCLP